MHSFFVALFRKLAITMKTVSIQVGDQAASRFNALSEQQKKELSKLVDNWVNDPKSIFKVMNEIGNYAKQQGLTQEILEKLLNDDRA